MTQAPMTIYAAGPIDLGSDIPNWRQDLMDMLNAAGMAAVLFDPSSSYKNAAWGEPEPGRTLYIEQVNKYALELANVFVACLPSKVPSVGTPIEIDMASKAGGTSSYLFTDIPRGKSVYLDNRFDEEHWVFVQNMSSVDDIRSALYTLADKLIIDNQSKRKQNSFVDTFGWPDETC